MDDDEESKLDVKSASFDPFLALYSDRVVVPRPDALVLDNVAKFEHLYNLGGDTPVRLDELLKKTQTKRKEKTQPSTSTDVEPRFESKNETTPRKFKPGKNILTRISTMSGPLAFLRDCMERRIRIKAWTRNAAGIRGYCHGFVIAFDKHWNLALSDVKEVWSRRVKRKTIPLVGSPSAVINRISSGFSSEMSRKTVVFALGEGFDPPRAWKLMGPVVTPPKIVILKTEKGVETCERHVNQMLMRGEHIAFISIADA